MTLTIMGDVNTQIQRYLAAGFGIRPLTMESLDVSTDRTTKKNARYVLQDKRCSPASVASWSSRMFHPDTDLPNVFSPCYPSGEHEPFDPIRVVQTASADSPMSLARLDHHPGAFVNPDVRDQRSSRVTRKEHEVPSLQAPAGRITDAGLTDGAPRELDAEFSIDVLGKAGAIEAARTFAAPEVRPTDQAGSKFDGIRCRHLGCEEQKRQRNRARDSWGHCGLPARAGCADRETQKGKTSASTVHAERAAAVAPTERRTRTSCRVWWTSAARQGDTARCV
jgi:hypothetical protein